MGKFILIIIIALIIAALLVFEPKIDITKEGKILLWYNNRNHNRKFKILW